MAPMTTTLLTTGEKAAAAKRRRALSRAVVTAMPPRRNSWGTNICSSVVPIARSSAASGVLLRTR